MMHFIDPRLREALAPFWPELDTVGSHVGGAMVVGEGEMVSVDDPATGELLFTYADAGAVVAAKAAGAALEGQAEWARHTAASRGRVMQGDRARHSCGQRAARAARVAQRRQADPRHARRSRQGRRDV
jgi:acyl-CoA reductase-like NAD-dependent aldehyde dehydrogenase